MPADDIRAVSRLAQDRGFIYPGSDIYGGLANAWDYGPYGSLLKDNIRTLWIREFVQRRTDMVFLDSAILMNSEVWVASGHVAGFSDPLIDDRNTGERFRADKLLEAHIETLITREWDADAALSYLRQRYDASTLLPESWDMATQARIMREEDVKNPNTLESADWTDVRKFNLMFETRQGVTDDSTNTIYLRPETAQGIFVNFANVARTTRKKVPFGVAQVGKSFRNEITPEKFIYRTREFEQMEIEFFCEPGTDLEWHERWKGDCMRFLTDTLGISSERLRMRDHDPDELSHYSTATTDIEYRFPFGWGELWGIADRTDYDLKQHMAHSGRDLSYLDPVENRKYIPYVIEPAVGLTRLVLVALCEACDRETTDEGERTIMRFPPRLAPITVAILPIVKKLAPEAKTIFMELSKHFHTEYDETGAIGKRYYRYDEIGTPWCVTVDSENSERWQVTVRHRDTGEQELVPIDDLVAWVRQRMGE